MILFSRVLIHFYLLDLDNFTIIDSPLQSFPNLFDLLVLLG